MPKAQIGLSNKANSQVSVMLVYYAYAEDLETIGCFLHFQDISEAPYLIQK